MADVRYEQATRTYPGTSSPAVDALDLHIQEGEFVVLVGPSGSGKTTALRMLAGLEEVDDGAIFIGERDVTDLAPKNRDIAMVFQNYALYPYLIGRGQHRLPAQAREGPESGARGARARRRRPARARPSSSSASRVSCPAASGNGSPWVARSSASRACS